MKKLCSETLKPLNKLSRRGEKLRRKKVFVVLQYTKVDKVKIFCVLHDKVALLTRRRSERGTRNRYKIISRKLLTIYI